MMIQLFKLIPLLPVLCATLILPAQHLRAHCQIPCGIYDDHARVRMLLEDASTVKKATVLLSELAGKHDPQSLQQTVRWISNKELHAQNIIATISDYFLTQRVQPSQDDYTERLATHHAVIRAAMHAKQSADGTDADALIESIQALKVYYPEPTHTH